MSSQNDREDELVTVAIAATFVAEPAEQPLGFWLQELGVPAQITFAPYNQIFQELVNPSSLLATNHNGVNVILARFEDWGHSATEAEAITETGFDSSRSMERNVRDFINALKRAVDRSQIPHLVFLCPASVTATLNPQQAMACRDMEELIASELAEVNGVHVVTTQQLAATYPVAEYYDAYGDQLARMPFTPLFFTALGTMIARKIFALKSARPKVIVLDCDQTLWGGVCGEDGALGVEIDPPRRAIQEFMVRQHDAGMLLCLCSKNNEEDVLEVFARRAEMVLKREHMVSWRINWRSKSENIRSLARELNLGLESFVFMDDDPVECAEVQANCPEVLTFRLPQSPPTIARVLNHLWILDQLKVTDEAKQRTDLYKQNAQRDLFRTGLSFKDFLASLDLKVEISALASEQVPRVAELTQRTNQFNLTTIRRSEGEIQKLCRPGGAECLVVHVKDRFGDYGLVGVMIFTVDARAVNTDTFLLSCRALGKGVEYQMLVRLAEIAQQRGLNRIDARYLQTKKNRPAIEFLDGIGAAFRESFDGGSVFRFPAEFAVSVSYDPQITERAGADTTEQQGAAVDAVHLVADARAKVDLLVWIAEEMYDAGRIQKVIAAQRRIRPKIKAPFVAPRARLEQKLAAMYAEILGVEQVGVDDSFFDLGGHSLLAMQLLSRIRQEFQTEIPIAVLFNGEFTVAELAKTVGRNQQQASPDQIDTILEQLDGLSDKEVKDLLAGSDAPGGERKVEKRKVE
jgi:FkbH-like protein